jgi:hypothetical protein
VTLRTSQPSFSINTETIALKGDFQLSISFDYLRKISNSSLFLLDGDSDISPFALVWITSITRRSAGHIFSRYVPTSSQLRLTPERSQKIVSQVVVFERRLSRTASSGRVLASNAMSGRSFDASIGACTWHRVCMQLLGDVGLNRIQPHHRRCNTGELKHIVGGDGFGLP